MESKNLRGGDSLKMTFSVTIFRSVVKRRFLKIQSRARV